MEHRHFLQSLTDEQRRELNVRDNWHALVRLTVLAGLFCLVICAIVLDAPMLPLWMLLQGLLLVSLFHLMHECVHETVFVARWANRLVAQLCGLILFLPALWFRYFHFAHHRYTQQKDKDPELASRKPETLMQWLVHVSGFPVWRQQVWLLVRSLWGTSKDSFIKKNKRSVVRVEMQLMLLVYLGLVVLAVVNQSFIILKVWILPLLIGQPFLRLYLLAEHTDCSYSDNMLSNTRTVLTNSIVKWFTWNMPYHAEHHVYPGVPFHRLPELHFLIKAHLHALDTGYVRFNGKYVSQLVSDQRPSSS